MATKADDVTYRLLASAIADYAIYMLDRDGGISTWNLDAETLTGYSTEDVMGKPFDILLCRGGSRSTATNQTCSNGRTVRPMRVRRLACAEGWLAVLVLFHSECNLRRGSPQNRRICQIHP